MVMTQSTKSDMWHDDKINDESKVWLEKHGWIWNVNGYWVGMRAGYIMCHNVSSAVLAQMRSWTLSLTSNSGTKETRKRWHRNIDEAVVLLLRLTLEEGFEKGNVAATEGKVAATEGKIAATGEESVVENGKNG